jgi:xanthine dehydrogenase YagR molybdenum-binding subunit
MSAAESRPGVPIAPEGWTPQAGPDPVLRGKHGLIGAQASRLDGAFKVRGEARFAAEYVMEGMVYASLRYSTIARGRIIALDTSAAEAAAGVVLVMTHRNAPRMQPTPPFFSAPRRPGVATCPSCRTTASTGTASRSQSSWPRRRSRPTMAPR